MDVRLREDGIVQDALAPSSAPSPTERQVSAAQTLLRLSEEYALFTPALLYALVPLGQRDPLADYVAMSPSHVTPSWLMSPLPVFSGLSGPHMAWNHRIGIMPRTHWDEFCQFFGRAAFSDAQTGGFYRTRWQQTTIDDALVAARATHLPQHGWPQVPIHVLCVESSSFTAYVRDGSFFAENRAYADTQLFAATWRAEADNPYNAVEQAVENATGVAPDAQRYNRAVAMPWLQDLMESTRRDFLTSVQPDNPEGKS